MLIGEVGDVSHEVGLVDTIRNLCDDNLIVGVAALNLSLGTHHDTATTCLIGILHTLQTIDISTCREVWTWDVLHQSLSVDIGVVDIGAAAVDHLSEVVCRHVGGHTYGDTVTTIDEQVGHLRRHDCRLLQRVVEVVHHIDGLFVEVVHDVLTHLREAALSVTHGGGRVAIDGAEVTLTVDERVAHVPVLGHTHEGTIYGRVAVWVVLTEYFTYHARTFLIRLCRYVVDVHHTVEDTAVYGFESVADIGKGTSYDD